MSTETKKANTKADEELVDIYIPLDHANEDDDVFYAAVNGKAMLIPKGEHVKVPKPYADAYKLVEQEQSALRAKKKAARAAAEKRKRELTED